MNNPFVSRVVRGDQWVWPISGMCLLLGLMTSMALVTQRNRISRIGLLDGSQRARISEASIDIVKYEEITKEVERLQKENTKFQNAAALGSNNAKLLNDTLQDVKGFAGLTEVEGPGIRVTVRDSPKGGTRVGNEVVFTPDTNIHDLDILRLVNELFASGAEAISVNEHRIAGPTSIRCVGPTILIDDVKVASPIVIRAIGDSKTLLGGLNLNGGVLSEIRASDPNMVTLEAVTLMKLPAFAGRTNFRLAHTVKDSK